MKVAIAVIAGLIGVVALSWYFAIAGRPLAKFGEETRRQVYEESVTARTACQRELLDLYTESLTVEGRRKRALEIAAIVEADRTRCDGLNPEVRAWIEEIR